MRFDHRNVPGAEYRALCAAADAVVKAAALMSWAELDALMVAVGRTQQYSDHCTDCGQGHQDYRSHPPVAGEECRPGSLKATYRCARGHVWTCRWRVEQS